MADTPGDTGAGPAREPSPATPTSPPSLVTRLAQAWDILKDVGTDVQGIVEGTQSVTGRPKQVYLAGLIGTCLVFLVAMLGVGKPLDTPLTVALICFIVIALPLLVFGFATLSFEVRRGLGSHQTAMVAGLGCATSCLGELLASLAVVVGVFAVVWHINPLVALLSIGASLLTPLAYALVARPFVVRQQADQERARPGNPATPDPAP